MPFSLADCILQPSGDPEKRRRLARETGSQPAPTGPPGGAAPRAATSPAEPRTEARPEKEMREIRELLKEANREWSGMLDAVRELRDALGPIDFETAFTAYCDAEKARTRPATSRPAPAVPVARASDTHRVAAPAAPAAPAVPVQTPATAPVAAPTAEARTPAPEPRPEPAPAKPPQASIEINAKLGELLKLVKENLGAKPGESPSRVEIPRHLTLEIAREVAGRVKDSVLSSLHQGAAAADASRAAASTAGPRSEPASPVPAAKRIPLDDIGALIDQLARQ